MTITDERGFFTSEASTLTDPLRDQVRSILNTATDEIHLRTLGCALKALVSDEISSALMKVRKSK